MEGFIYLWKNNIDGKKYIGSHIGSLEDGYIGSGKYFTRAVAKYGLCYFERIILEEVEDKNDVYQREQFFLDLYNAAEDPNFYNLSNQAGGGFQLINNDPILKKQNEDRLQQWFKENEHPKGMKGKKHPNYQPCYDARMKYIQKIKKSIEQWDLYGNFIQKFDSITEAAKSVSGTPSNIKYTADGKFKKAYNYVWKWSK